MSKDIVESPLISAQELQNILDKDNVKIFDVRGKWDVPPISHYANYLEGHIPGATYLNWGLHFLEQGMPVNLASVAPKDDAQKSFKELGISAEDTVVLYDDYHHMLAGRIWWAMRYWGFTNVKVLDGGWNNWLVEGAPITKDIPRIELGGFHVSEKTDLRVNIESVKNRNETTYLIDARGPINYGGKPDDLRTGHIPGAINIPYSSLLNSDTGKFKSKKELQDIVETALTKEVIENIGDIKIISSCGSGYAVTVMLIVLQEIGIEASLFDGSFSQWKADESLPIERGKG